MILLLDIGNSRIKWASVQGDRLSEMRAISHHREDCADLIAEVMRRMEQQPAHVLASNVLPEAIRLSIAARIHAEFGVSVEHVIPKQKAYGIRSGYLRPESLGVDRYVALIAARSMYRSNCIVIDCGTAVTVDALRHDGRHLGGLITPGLQLMEQSLIRRTSLAAPISGDDQALFGTTTSQALRSGCLRFLAASIEGVCHQMTGVLGPDVARLLCGGDAPRVAPLMGGRYDNQPDLVLRGLSIIATS